MEQIFRVSDWLDMSAAISFAAFLASLAAFWTLRLAPSSRRRNIAATVASGLVAVSLIAFGALLVLTAYILPVRAAFIVVNGNPSASTVAIAGEAHRIEGAGWKRIALRAVPGSGSSAPVPVALEGEPAVLLKPGLYLVNTSAAKWVGWETWERVEQGGASSVLHRPLTTRGRGVHLVTENLDDIVHHFSPRPPAEETLRSTKRRRIRLLSER